MPMTIAERLAQMKIDRQKSVLNAEPIKQTEPAGNSDLTPPVNDAEYIYKQLQDVKKLEDNLVELAVKLPVIQLNEKQKLFTTTALTGKSCCLIGSAGTGKTTATQMMTTQLIDSGSIPLIEQATKYLKVGLPGIVVLSFTNKAVNNIRRKVDPRIAAHTMTTHKLLEFAPVKKMVIDDKTGQSKMRMTFQPTRDRYNPLPADIKVVIWEESSMIGSPLYNLFKDAMQHEYQEIFLGDIQQLPPVFGLAVLGFKMDELPVIELTEIYRQALESPIIRLAQKILDGNPHDFSGAVERYKYETTGKSRLRCPGLEKYNEDGPHGSVKFQIWQTATNETQAIKATEMLFRNWYKEGYYNPDEDVILCPYNKAYGTLEINKHLLQFFSREKGNPVHEIVAGYERVYWAIGDRVLFDKEDAFIETIELNPGYTGKTNYSPPSINLDRWGHQIGEMTEAEILQARAASDTNATEQVEYFLDGGNNLDEIDERSNQASHIITVRLKWGDIVRSLKTAKELKDLIGGHCITVHKFQGSEAEKVFVLLHSMHNKMISRELLYTAVTRAKRHLHILCENMSFQKGVGSQRIEGNSLAEKIELFKGKVREGEDYEIPLPTVDREIIQLGQPASNKIKQTYKTEILQETKSCIQLDDKSRVRVQESGVPIEAAKLKAELTMAERLEQMRAKMKKQYR